MSKKMWHKIFKSKSQKQQTQLNKINKRHSRGIIYEEYQQLNELLNDEKSQALRLCSENENQSGNENGNGNGSSGNGNGNINVFEQQPQQSSFNSKALSEAQQQQLQQQQQQSQQLSTFSRVRNTFSLRRSSNNNKSDSNKNQATNAKSTTMESDAADDDQNEELPGPPPPPISGMSIPVPEYGGDSTELSPCPNCSRKFNPTALRKHAVVCEKMAAKKRKPFDSSRQRRDGTALSTYVLPKNFGLPNAEKAAGLHTPPGVSRESSTVVNSEAAASPLPTRRRADPDKARRGTLRKGAAAAPECPAAASPQAAPAAAAPQDYVREKAARAERSRVRRSVKEPATDKCPHCERSFNPKAFDRHVEWCKEKAIQNNMKSSSSNTAETKAKERMEARKQYRPPNLKTKRSLNRDKYSGSQEEQYEAEMVAQKQAQMMTSSMHSDNGIISDKYDPFLSAKRQLEELCSPNTPPDNEPCTTMSTSLTSTLGKPHTTTTTTTTPTTTTSKLTPMSNFRRTSSLRGPRRTPLLPSRPLFATNYRPTIQRGLSDEGPISNNFLKPEEYDEMPVRAACVNDFHSPRVVRRDTSASNRKQQLKLPLGGATEPTDGASKPTTRNVAKTDSLAVFLKYEHELEQLNAKAAEVAANSKELNTKELKDKSNNLSKQNSAKNLTLSPNSGQLPPLTTPISPPGSATTAPKENNENQAHNFATPLRLEPINKPMTPLTPNNSNNNSGAPIKLESIFGVNRLGGGGDYIDPKLINPCDNLHVQQSSTGSSSNASSTPQQISQSRSSSQSTITTNQEQRRHSGDSRNLLKRKMRLGRNQFLYDASPEEEAYISSSGSCADDEANRSSLESDEQCWQQQQKQLLSKNLLNPLSPMPQLPTFDDFDFEEFLSSFENENDEEQFPLFRDCREFLLNRTTSRHRASFQKATSTLTSTPLQPQPQTPTATQKTSQLIMSPKYTPTTKETHAHRSDSNISSGSYRTPATSSGSYKTPMTSGDEKMQRQQSNMGSSQKSQKSIDKSEIFISIDTEPNAQGRSPISPASLRHMVGNAQTPIDVLHIENGNEPEHAKFSKISDSEDHFDAGLDDEISRVHYKKRLNSTASAAAKLPLPNVEANNAKNAIEKMRSDFQQLGEEVGASMRRDMMQRKEQVQQQQQQKKAQQELNVNAPLTPSPSGDSDELSSLDGYPMSSSQSSRRGASSKLSSDSAYGSTNSPYSLSRQRSGEQEHSNITQRSQHQMRPHTASGALASAGKLSSAMMDASTQAASNYGTLKARQRMFAGSFSGGGGGGDGDGPGDCCPAYSSSSSEHSMPQQQQQQQNSNYNYQQQQSQMQAAYNNNNNNSYEHMKNMNNHNNNNTMTPTTSQHSLVSNTSNGSSNMSASMKMSKFCHECGGKFILEHAKFCMECGVRRVVL